MTADIDPAESANARGDFSLQQQSPSFCNVHTWLRWKWGYAYAAQQTYKKLMFPKASFENTYVCLI